MILRIAVFALMAIGLIGFGGIAWVVMKPPATAHVAAEAPTKTTVLTAAHAIRAGGLLKPEDIAAKEIANTELPPDASANTQDARRSLAGAMVRHSLAAGEPIRTGDVMRPGDHGFLAAVLDPGMRAMTVAVDAVTGSAGLIWPGDRVDLILTLTIGEANQPIGRRVAAETVLPDVRVIAIDQQLMQGADTNSGFRQPGTYRHAGSDAGTGRACLGGGAPWQAVAVRAFRRGGAGRHPGRGGTQYHLGVRRLAGAWPRRGPADDARHHAGISGFR